MLLSGGATVLLWSPQTSIEEYAVSFFQDPVTGSIACHEAATADSLGPAGSIAADQSLLVFDYIAYMPRPHLLERWLRYRCVSAFDFSSHGEMTEQLCALDSTRRLALGHYFRNSVSDARLADMIVSNRLVAVTIDSRTLAGDALCALAAALFGSVLARMALAKYAILKRRRRIMRNECPVCAHPVQATICTECGCCISEATSV